MIGIGLDFGTSNSAAAYFDGDKIQLISLDKSDAIMPTALHLNRNLSTATGSAAVSQYIEENRERIVELTPEVIASTSMLTSESDSDSPSSEVETDTSNVYGQPWVDRGMPGRLFRGVKRLLGNSSINRLLVFDSPFRLVALITPILLEIRKAIEKATGESLENIHFGHPVLFEGNENSRNMLAFDRLLEASGYAGIDKLTFYPEPVAATLSYRYSAQSPGNGCVLTVDFGGGTLDLSVVEYAGDRFDVLSTCGIALGGDHIDQLIFKELLFPYFGKGEIWSRVRDGHLIENEFPFEEFEDRLLNWAVTYSLNQNQYRAKIIDRIKQGGKGKEKFERLLELITYNFSYLVFESIKKAKVELSSLEETVIDIPELDLEVPFSKNRFDTIMADMLRRIENITDQTLKASGKKNGDIDIVIRTGGSSQITSVKRLLEEKFPGKVTEHDPFTSVAAGLAVANFYGYKFDEE